VEVVCCQVQAKQDIQVWLQGKIPVFRLPIVSIQLELFAEAVKVKVSKLVLS